jgi:hypothetical protein
MIAQSMALAQSAMDNPAPFVTVVRHAPALFPMSARPTPMMPLALNPFAIRSLAKSVPLLPETAFANLRIAILASSVVIRLSAHAQEKVAPTSAKAPTAPSAMRAKTEKASNALPASDPIASPAQVPIALLANQHHARPALI